MNWDDLRYVLAVSRAGSLAGAAKELRVNHTTVGRRVEAAEAALGMRLFTRTTLGYVPTAEGERIIEHLGGVENAVIALERGADAQQHTVSGVVRVTSPETLGCMYLAPVLAGLRRQHAELAIELMSTGAILDLARREADIAVRHFRSGHESLVVKRVAYVAYGLYGAKTYLAERPVTVASELRGHQILTAATGPNVVDANWFHELVGEAPPALVCDLSMALLEAARAGEGIAVLPRYVGDADTTLHHLEMPNEPREPVWIAVHRDVKDAPRVRAVVDHLTASFHADRDRLSPKR